jgi:hypothetical protein
MALSRALGFLAFLPLSVLLFACGGGTSGPGDDAGGTGATSSSGGSDNPGAGGTENPGAGGSGAASSGGSAPGGTGNVGDNPLPAPTGPCPNLTMESGVAVDGPEATTNNRFNYGDMDCLPRSAFMTDGTGNGNRGYLSRYAYEPTAGETRTATGTNASNNWNGFGFIINHGGSGGDAYDAPVTSLGGPNHAIYEYRSTKGSVVIHRNWFFAAGRSHPVIAITFDSTDAGTGLGWDTRTPYGDLAWDGDGSSTTISGVGWGDQYKFITTAAPLSMNSTWDYATPNTVPYAFEWTDAAQGQNDAEMGLVQTQTYLQQDAGSAWYYPNWGKTSETQDEATRTGSNQPGTMPVTWNWPYQLNQYELCLDTPDCVNNNTGSHRVCWGTNYGAIGGDGADGMYDSMSADRRLSGHPYNSYSVFMVLGTHSGEAVFKQVSEIEAVQQTTLVATVGTVATMGPGGAGRTDLIPLAPAGYDHVYSTWHVIADGNKAAFTTTVAAGMIQNPVVVIENYTATEPPAKVLQNGTEGVVDVDYLPTVDTAGQKLWLTLRPGWQGTSSVSIE